MREHTDDHHLDQLFSAVSDFDRRQLLLALWQARDDETVAVSDLDIDRDDRDLALAFHHVHLPKLEQNGLVEVVEPGERVRRGPQFPEIEPILESVTTDYGEPPLHSH